MWLFLVCWGVFPRLLRRLIFSFRHLVHLVVLGVRWLFSRSNMQSACSFNIRHAICSHHVLGHFLFLFVHCFICLLSLSAAVSGSSLVWFCSIFHFLYFYVCSELLCFYFQIFGFCLLVDLVAYYICCVILFFTSFALSFWLTFFLSLESSGCLQSVPWLFSQFVCNPLVLSISDGCSHCVNSHFRVFFVCRFICLSLSPVLSDFPFYLRGFLFFIFIYFKVLFIYVLFLLVVVFFWLFSQYAALPCSYFHMPGYCLFVLSVCWFTWLFFISAA